MKRAVPEDTPDDRIEEMYACLLDYYGSHCMIKTRPYPGIPELLHELRQLGYKTAVISNKADAAVRELAEKMFAGCFDYAIGATEGIKLKPDRAMIDIALEKLSICPDEAVYVGDSQVDIQTAENAQMDCISVTWGFRDRNVLIERGASVLADTPEQILEIIKGMG